MGEVCVCVCGGGGGEGGEGGVGKLPYPLNLNISSKRWFHSNDKLVYIKPIHKGSFKRHGKNIGLGPKTGLIDTAPLVSTLIG